MRRVIILTLTGIATCSLLLWNILSTSPNQNPGLSVVLPIIVGLFVVFVFALLKLFFSRAHYGRSLVIATYRQGLLLGIVSGSLLFLQGLRILNPLDAILLIVAAFLLELFFLSEKTDIRQPKDD